MHYVKKFMERNIKYIRKEAMLKTPAITVRKDTIVYENGHEETKEIIEEPEGVLILPITQSGSIILIREFRHNHGWIYSVPMGKREQNESSALVSAQREIR